MSNFRSEQEWSQMNKLATKNNGQVSVKKNINNHKLTVKNVSSDELNSFNLSNTVSSGSQHDSNQENIFNGAVLNGAQQQQISSATTNVNKQKNYYAQSRFQSQQQQAIDRDSLTISLSSQEDGPFFNQQISPSGQLSAQKPVNLASNINSYYLQQSDMKLQNSDRCRNQPLKQQYLSSPKKLTLTKPQLQLDSITEQNNSVAYDQNKYNPNGSGQQKSQQKKDYQSGTMYMNTQQSTQLCTQSSLPSSSTAVKHIGQQQNIMSTTNFTEMSTYEQQLDNLQKQVQIMEDELNVNKNAVNTKISEMFTGAPTRGNKGVQPITELQNDDFSFDDDQSSVPQEQSHTQSIEAENNSHNQEEESTPMSSSKNQSLQEEEHWSSSEGNIPVDENNNQTAECSHHHPHEDSLYTCDKDQYGKLKQLVHTAKDAIDSLKVEIDLLRDQNSGTDAQMRHLLNRLYKDQVGKKAEIMTVNFTMANNQTVNYKHNEPVSSARSGKSSQSPSMRNNNNIYNKAAFKEELFKAINLSEKHKQLAKNCRSSSARYNMHKPIFYHVKNEQTQASTNVTADDAENSKNKIRIASLERELAILKMNYDKNRSPQPITSNSSRNKKPLQYCGSGSLVTLVKDKGMFTRESKKNRRHTHQGDLIQPQNVNKSQQQETNNTAPLPPKKNYTHLKQRYISNFNKS